MSRTKRALWLTALSVLTGGCWSPRLLALDPALDISQYGHSVWTSSNGFSPGAVYAIAQTADGYLWLGTQSGVFRFDGMRTTPLPPQSSRALADAAVGYLLPSRDGALWIGTLDGLVTWKNGRLTEQPMIGRRRINALLQDRDGTIWVGTALGGQNGRLCSISGDRTQCYGDDGSLGGAVESLYEDKDGSLWVGGANGLWRWKPGPPVRYLETPVLERQSLAQGDHGAGLMIAMGNLRQLVGTKAEDYPLPGLPSSLTALRVLRDRNGGLWIGTDTSGLIRAYQGRISTFTQKDGLTSDQIKALFEDGEGTIWVGTSAGFDQFRELAVTTVSVEEGLSDPVVYSLLAARDGSVWIGTGNGLDRLNAGHVTIYRSKDTPSMLDNNIDSILEDERGRIWASGFHWLSAFENGKFTPVPAVPRSTKFAIADDHQGGLWLSLWFTAKDSGLAHLLGGKIIEQAPWEKLGGGPGTGGLVADSDGGAWVGLHSGGIAYFRGGHIRNLPLNDDRGVASRVFDLSRDRDGTLWASTENGLSRISGASIATLTTANGLPCNKVYWIVADDSSAYWLYTRCGLVRIERRELDGWVADRKRVIRVRTFDEADGIRLAPNLDGVKPEVTKSPDGKIWFVNGRTASFFDPSRMATNPTPPPVHIDQIIADRNSYDATEGLRLPPRVRDLSIDYTAISFVVPEKVHFRYRLEGQDPDWREVVNNREVHYSNLAPGKYRFRVTASNHSGVWGAEAVALDFAIAPAYWQTAWFRALSVASVLAVLGALYWLRMRQLAHRFDAELEARVEERTQIARELHDTLLQSFNGLLLRFRTVQALLSTRSEEARQVLENAIDETRRALVEGREAVQGLRSSARDEREFDQAIRALAEELANEHGGAVEVRLNIEGSPRPLRPLIRDEIYRIASEALRNAFQHAEASRIEALLGYDERGFELRVRDDGKGIDPEFLSEKEVPGHFGLRGMRERAEKIGGKFKAWSAPASGTEVVLSVPGTSAYGTDERGASAWLARKVWRDH